MALINGFDNDIFISYAHVDNLNGPAGGAEKGWVISFAKMLQTTLRDTLKKQIALNERELKIYWDERVAQGEPIDWQLNPAVEQSAIFLMIMSEHYLSSEWCNREANWFLENIAGRPDVRNNKLWPAFVVSVANTDKDHWPDNYSLRNTKPFVFHDVNRHNIDPRYAYPSIALNPMDTPYYPEFNNLQTALTNCILKALTLNQSALPMPEPALISDPLDSGSATIPNDDDPVGQLSIYAAPSVVVAATDDMARKAQRLVDMCTAEELSAEILADTAGSSHSTLDNSMSQAKLAVFLLGMFPSHAPGVKADLFQQIYASTKQKDIKTILWMQSGGMIDLIDDDFEEYKSFLNLISNDVEIFKFDEFPAKMSEFKATLRDEIQEPEPEPEHIPRGKVKLFIDAAKIDHSLATDLKSIIDSKNLNFRTFVPSLGVNQQERNEEWSKVVGRCDGVILMYGAVDIDAIDDKLDQVELLSAKRKSLKKSEISIAIVDAPPLSSVDLSAPNVQMISVEEELDTERIIEFLTDLSDKHSLSPRVTI